MENKEVVSIPFVAHESDMNRIERINKRLSVIIIVEAIIILLMFVGIMIYFYLPSEVVEEDISQNIQDITDSDIKQSIGE